MPPHPPRGRFFWSDNFMDDAVCKYPYRWYWRAKLGKYKGRPCRVLVRGKMNSILVEFDDGYRVVTGRFAVRRAKKGMKDG